MAPLCPTTARRERGRYAALVRSRSADDPELVEAHRRMREEALVGAIQRALMKAPPISQQFRRRLIALIPDKNDFRGAA